MKKNTGHISAYLKFKLNLTKRINIYERLKSYTEEEFPVYESLIKFKARYDKKKDFRGKIIANWLESMNNGLSFSQAIEGWVPDAELNLIASGEEGSGIEKGLGEAISFGNSAQKIKSTIITGITYPVVLLLVVGGFVAMFSVKLAPTYLSMLPLEEWPSLGQNFYAFSKFIVDYWYMVFAGIGVSSYIMMKTIGNWTGPIRNIFDYVPPWSVYKVYQSSAFLISLASMMQSGTPLNDALKRIKNTSSPWLQIYVEDMMKNLRKGGKNFGQHLNVGLMDEETAGDIIDYSELGKFESARYTIGNKNLESSVAKIESRMGIVRNLMIVLVGITVGVIYYTTIELNTKVADSASSQTR